MIKDLIAGFTAYGTALRLLGRYRLWGYALVPGLISLLLGGLMLYGAWHFSGRIADWLVGFYPWDWGRVVLERIAQVFGGLLTLALGLLLFRHLVMALSSPFMSFLSESIERRLGGQRQPLPFSLGRAARELRRGLHISLRNISRELFYTLLLFVLGLGIPLLSPLLPFALFGVQAFYAGFGNIDFTLERHLDVRGSVAFARRHRGLCLGNGAAFLLLLFTGIGFLFALPLGTVAGSREAVRRLE